MTTQTALSDVTMSDNEHVLQQHEYQFVEFGESAPNGSQIADLARLHAALLPHSPVVLMGEDFMCDFYYKALTSDKQICGAIAYIDGKPAGFIVATHNPKEFMPMAIRRHWFSLGMVIFLSLLRSPTRIMAMKEAYTIQKNVGDIEYEAGLGELLSFGVLPEYRSPKFVRKTGHKISSDLLTAAVSLLRKRAMKKIRAVVDQDNTEAKFFYRSHNWKIGNPSVQGWSVPTLEFILDLEDKQET